ncbi:spore coat protein CotJB [Polycladomyces abyssicola]|uniref:Spore coat protein CotJB n=1 Tax=Polycladomyces abyssicola TaxID=1125966 RepID=A0A8D5ZND3_9BACL|nr:spore coat protein CotJB [Polycladomyces abyssicola]BCU82605.1 spore coat protein CotJB [Polycladomyces abyssicola]
MSKMSKEYYQLLHQLQVVDFVLVELNLYLDTHPGDTRTIQQYNSYAQKRSQLKKEFESRFGPLTHFGHSYNQYPGGWNEGPWPWEV